jgi:hypothetical protein
VKPGAKPAAKVDAKKDEPKLKAVASDDRESFRAAIKIEVK